MKKLMSILAINTLLAVSGALAQTPPETTGAIPLTLTDQQAKAWVDKNVYSSDDKKLGEVAEVVRDPSGKVTELHADIGGFLGIGETRVRVMPNQFHMVNDKVVLNLTGDQAKALPQVENK